MKKDIIFSFIVNLFIVLFIGIVLFWSVTTKTEIPIPIGLCVGIISGQQLFASVAWFKGFIFYVQTKDPLLKITLGSHLSDNSPLNDTITTLSGCKGMLKAIDQNFPNSVFPSLIENMELKITQVKHNSPE